jgi:hypothetical protein
MRFHVADIATRKALSISLHFMTLTEASYLIQT